MKKIGFATELKEDILSGKKTITYRLGDKYGNLFKVGDLVDAVDSSTDEIFSKLKVVSLSVLPLKNIPLEKEGHEKYASLGEMIDNLKKYYTQKITQETLFTIISFKKI